MTTEPIPWSAVRGRVVVLVFWSFGCEASLLRLRQIGRLARNHPDLLCLAVHTPRFPYEDDLARLEVAIARHRIDVEVVHDPRYLTWSRYGIEGWPSTVIVDRQGRVAGLAPGVDDLDLLAEVVNELRRDRSPVGTGPTGLSTGSRREVELTAPNPDAVAAPWGLAAIGDRLAVADSGNDRILVGDLDRFQSRLQVTQVFDGLSQPGPVATDGGRLYVGEIGSSAVTSIDLVSGRRRPVGERFLAPVGLTMDRDGSLLVADAADERIHRVESAPPDGNAAVGVVAGSGRTGHRDGPAAKADLAQPVAMTRVEDGVAFLDAASSSLRLLTDDGAVLTVAGGDFDNWGLIDGAAHRAMFQRPGGLCRLDDGSLVVADTGNGRLRVVRERRVVTVGLTGLDQPTDVIPIGPDRLIVSDPGRHRLVVVDLAACDAWPLAVDIVDEPSTAGSPASTVHREPVTRVVDRAGTNVRQAVSSRGA